MTMIFLVTEGQGGAHHPDAVYGAWTTRAAAQADVDRRNEQIRRDGFGDDFALVEVDLDRPYECPVN